MIYFRYLYSHFKATNFLLMKKTSLLSLFTLAFLSAIAQQTDFRILFKSGNVETTPNLQNFLSAKVSASETVNGHYYRIVQFQNIPSTETKQLLAQNGIKLLGYIPNNAFIASINNSANLSSLQDYGTRAVMEMKSEFKMGSDILSGNYPDWCVKESGKIEVNIIYHEDLTEAEAQKLFAENKITAASSKPHVRRITTVISTSELFSIASLPFIQFIESGDAPAEPENLVERTDHRTNAISTEFPGGRKYDGAGINVMLQDDGIIGPHIDYTGRIGAQYPTFDNGNHGDHVGGTIFGAGNRDPKTKGMAPGAMLWVYGASPSYPGFDSIYNHYVSPGIVITSTSYSNGCNAGYNSLTQMCDQQTRQMPSLVHVFSSGNVGTSDCGYGAGAGWGNISGGHKQGKNVIAVGNLTYQDVLASSSSRGPAHDGRIKPDVCAVGTSVNSTMDPDTYQVLTGTSMSCPGVSGTLADLYQAYKIANGNTNPESALMKGILMNTCDDLGNPGPDFRHGYGRINALRAAKVIESAQHLSGTVSQGNTNTHNITVPNGTMQVRIMITWTDYEATINTTKALINDLNMVVTDPSSTGFNPWVLDETPNATNLNTNAIRGVDNLNNSEQVTIDNPLSGNYVISVNGFAVPQGPQKYFINYEFVQDVITVIYPIGGEGLAPTETETIRWDAWGTTGNFTIEYSSDNGSTWTVITSTVTGSQRYYNWTVPTPATATGQCLIRVSRNAISDVSDANFSIIRVPTGLVVDTVCPNAFRFKWNATTGATGYEVSLLGTTYMDSIGTTTATNMWIWNVSSANTYWLSVKALGPQNAEGRRANAYKRNPSTPNCINTAVVEAMNETGFSVYPNPSIDGEFTIYNSENATYDLKIYNVMGEKIYSDQVINNTSHTIHTDLPKGVYFLNISSGNGKFYTKLVMQ